MPEKGRGSGGGGTLGGNKGERQAGASYVHELLWLWLGGGGTTNAEGEYEGEEREGGREWGDAHATDAQHNNTQCGVTSAVQVRHRERKGREEQKKGKKDGVELGTGPRAGERPPTHIKSKPTGTTLCPWRSVTLTSVDSGVGEASVSITGGVEPVIETIPT